MAREATPRGRSRFFPRGHCLFPQLAGCVPPPRLHFPTGCCRSGAAGRGRPGSLRLTPPPTARTHPPPPNFRKFGLGLPSPEQAQAQPNLLAPLSAPDLHCSPGRRPPQQEQLLSLRLPARPRPGPPGHTPARRAAPRTRLGARGARGRMPSSRRPPAPRTHAAHAPLLQLGPPAAPPGPRAPP